MSKEDEPDDECPLLTSGLAYENMREAGLQLIFYEAGKEWWLADADGETAVVSWPLMFAVAWYVDLFAFVASKRLAWCHGCDEVYAPADKASTKCPMCGSKEVENVTRTKQRIIIKEEEK